MAWIALAFAIFAVIYNSRTINKCEQSMKRTNEMLKEIIARHEK